MAPDHTHGGGGGIDLTTSVRSIQSFGSPLASHINGITLITHGWYCVILPHGDMYVGPYGTLVVVVVVVVGGGVTNGHLNRLTQSQLQEHGYLVLRTRVIKF